MAKTWTEEGEERGILKGEQRVVKRQLEKRFGPLDAAVQQKLTSLPIERLEQISEALLTATSLRELGLEN